MLWLVAASFALAAVSLVVPPHGVASASYDPIEWLIWGREVIHLDLVTSAGPSWKPLPVLFTAPFSVFRDAVAPTLWLAVARAGGILGVLLAYRVAARVAGRLGGALAVAALILELNYLVDGERGETEALMVALVLLATSASRGAIAARSWPGPAPPCCAPRRGRSSPPTACGCWRATAARPNGGGR